MADYIKSYDILHIIFLCEVLAALINSGLLASRHVINAVSARSVTCG
jgi:hypothetical protein